ncbi:sugar ABC transporter ATP-binding protein [Salinibacterium sp. ZJ454]|uniref:sugar ABC transporter ATP-binding protein n=1 Tax=Salinibacterium sp. ZJ454 TaxID=2708339 RepID=UPI00141E8911|nr:sugar ABC transporter ATP-binding protein [Salinibacterium sp. ZJ454]
MPDPIVELRNVKKSFGGALAVNNVSLSIKPGTVHALVGENGAGKSTLGNLIAGIHVPDSGDIYVEGRAVRFREPVDSISEGIVAIQQEIALVPGRSVLDNVFLGKETTRWSVVDVRSQRIRYDELTKESGFRIDPDVKAGSLRIADQQKVEVLRGLARQARVMVFDEPTAALTPNETDALVRLVKRLRDAGVTVIYVSHFLDEILELADDISILRNGQLVRSGPAALETKSTLVTAMLGRELTAAFPPRVGRARLDGGPALRVSGLTRRGVVEDISFDINPGEIVGITGLVGSGRTETLRAIFGADPPDRGEAALGDGQRLARHPAKSVRAGVAMVSENRKEDGLLHERDVTDNMTLVHPGIVERSGWRDRRKERVAVTTMMNRLDMRPPRPNLQAKLLSGGNQQKLMLGKWLLREPKVLLIDEPTRGVDVGAKFQIYEALFALADSGMAILFVSSDIEEVLGLADRVIVMRRGRMVIDQPRADVEHHYVMHHAFGFDTSESEFTDEH